jgi:hypothetical protein
MVKNYFEQKRFLYSYWRFFWKWFTVEFQKDVSLSRFLEKWFAAKQDQKPISGKIEFFGEKGSVSYWGSRIMEREFMGGSQSPAPWIIEILIVSHDSEDAKKSYKEIQHIKV